MFTRKLLGLIIGALGIFFLPYLSWAGDFSAFEKRIVELERAAGEMDFDSRYKEFNKARKDLDRIKRQGKRDSEENEISMSLYIEALSDFPMNQISKKKCNEIQKSSQSMNRTSSEEAEENAFLLRAVKLSSNLCK